jgi:hypothetical protein
MICTGKYTFVEEKILQWWTVLLLFADCYDARNLFAAFPLMRYRYRYFIILEVLFELHYRYFTVNEFFV